MTASTSLGGCEALAALLGAEKVSLPGSAAYNASLSSYFALQSSAVQPLCFVSPQTTGDVSAVIGWLTANPSGGSYEFAIRSGGHLWVPGASNAPGGVTIDLRGLDSIELSADNSTASVGVGATWDAVYAKLDPLGLSVAGGRIAGVGVGGLTLGGGISHFGPRHGWTCDTATAFEVVLADGSIVEADGQQNSDLFHGLRGGSNNFGIVTRIDLKTFEQGLVWNSTTYHPISTIDDHVKIFANISAAENYDENASFITGFGYSQSQGLTVINNVLVYTKPVENPPYYQEFLSLPTIYNSSAILNVTTLSQQGARLLPPGMARYLFATTTFLPTEAMLRAAFDAWNSSLEGVKDISGLTWSLSFEPLPPAIYQRGAEANAMGLVDRTGTRVVCLLSQGWANQADDERVYAASAALVAAIEEAARTLGAYDPFLYLNYAAKWQDPIATYGNASVQQLQELRARVDPKGVFTHLVPGGFKIPS
ncbi:hypothetical protein DL769_001144 [Monosporascus sp. CRB-8-3]|nr:hypothetical protein DL769_001144 [Monosporascus sp. CRB-8-3]